MLLELARALSFFLSVLSLYPVLMSAFFVPGTSWKERLVKALLDVAFAACVCFSSGILFIWPSRTSPQSGQSLLASLPVRLFFLALAGMSAVSSPDHGFCRNRLRRILQRATHITLYNQNWRRLPQNLVRMPNATT